MLQYQQSYTTLMIIIAPLEGNHIKNIILRMLILIDNQRIMINMTLIGFHCFVIICLLIYFDFIDLRWFLCKRNLMILIDFTVFINFNDLVWFYWILLIYNYIYTEGRIM